MRGKIRRVVEVRGVERVNPDSGPGFYRATVRLECGHVVKAMAKDRYRKDAAPVIGFCMHPDCIAGKVAA